MSTYVLCGGSGAVGSRLTASLAGDGHEVVVVTRDPSKHKGPGRSVAWDQLGEVVEGAAAVVNLAGRPISARWTAEVLREVEQSRVDSTVKVAKAIAGATNPPAVWVQASAVGIYGDRGDAILDDTAGPPEPGSAADNTLARVCRPWEAAANSVETPRTRRVLVRIGIVFEPHAGAAPSLLKLAKFGLGGRAGSGRQWIPWIDARDMTRLLRFVMDDERCVGTFNAVSPQPARNADVMASFRRAAGRPVGLPAPAWGIRLGRKVAGVPDDLALASTRVVPKRLLDMGFAFEHVELDEVTSHMAQA